jgi:hypothetical protein
MNPEPRLLRFCSWALCALFWLVFLPFASAAPASVLKSPDGRIELKVELSSKIYYSVNSVMARCSAPTRH